MVTLEATFDNFDVSVSMLIVWCGVEFIVSLCFFLPEISASPYAPLANFSCGILAGVLASLVTQPADVVKTHVQVSPHLYKRTADAVRYIYNVTISLGVLLNTALLLCLGQ